MKKYLLLFMLVITLTGCGAKGTPYEQLSQAITKTWSNDLLEASFDVKIGNKSLPSYYIAIDRKGNAGTAKVFGLPFYFDQQYAYIDNDDEWIKIKFKQPIDFATLGKGNRNYKFPEGTDKIENVDSGSELIDNALNGKTPNDIVVSTGNHSYSIVGLEDGFTISTKNGITIKFDDPTTKLSITVTYKAGKIVLIPKETEDAIDMTGVFGEAFKSAISDLTK